MAARPQPWIRGGLGFPGSDPSMASRRLLVVGVAVAAVFYSLWVLWVVAWAGDAGIRSVMSVDIKQEVSPEFDWAPDRPAVGDLLVSIDGRPILNYNDYIRAMRQFRHQVDETIRVVWKTPQGQVKQADAKVRYRPFRMYVWSLVWFVQEMLIFAVGFYVFWKRPRDASAHLFFWLCIVTVGAFMGGYHWTEIVVEPVLIYLFVLFALFVPVVSLHLYLVFPRVHPIYEKHRRGVLSLIYGIGLIYLGLLWTFMVISRLRTEPGVDTAIWIIKQLAYGYIGLSVVYFGLCIALLRTSYRTATNRSERNQAYWIWLASVLGTLPISYQLWTAWNNPSTLGLASAAWPMFVVSMLYTIAYAFSITRYKLMQVEEIYNRGKLYVMASLSAGLLYSAILVTCGVVIRDQLMAYRTTGAITAGAVAIVILVLTGAARDRFQKVIDKRFYREKYKFDQALQRMNLAVGSLVDRETLGRRLLEAAADVLRIEWAALYLCDQDRGPLKLVACHGPEPDERTLPADNPLVERLRGTTVLRMPSMMGFSPPSDPAIDAMISLGGEHAAALESNGLLAGLLVLGPKRSGLPYEDEEVAFLNALGSVAILALHSAGIHQTLERLNQELRAKVEKIAEQQRRILILQDQLAQGRGDDAGVREPGELPEPMVFGPIKGSSPAVRRMLELARRVAASHSAVLIRGESGTGKELLAEAIHSASPRAGRPFVKVHCAALSQGLLESELFGHVKGAFTGADRDRVGRFEQANGGTLFLDEIGDINLEVQTKLLRVLQEMSFERVGSSHTISVDVRILAATHQDLEALIEQGRFREDLFYRLNVIPLRTPSLRERKDDIFELAVHFLRRHAGTTGRPVTHLEESAVESLLSYDWPGNIRELENVIERAVLLSDGPALTVEDLAQEIREPVRFARGRPKVRGRRAVVRLGSRAALPGPKQAEPATRSLPAPGDTATTTAARPQLQTLGDEADEYERIQLLDALNEAGGNKSEAARLLGLPRSTFFSKLKKHRLLDVE